jgi:hypothetical protein
MALLAGLMGGDSDWLIASDGVGPADDRAVALKAELQRLHKKSVSGTVTAGEQEYLLDLVPAVNAAAVIAAATKLTSWMAPGIPITADAVRRAAGSLHNAVLFAGSVTPELRATKAESQRLEKMPRLRRSDVLPYADAVFATARALPRPSAATLHFVRSIAI